MPGHVLLSPLFQSRDWLGFHGAAAWPHLPDPFVLNARQVHSHRHGGVAMQELPSRDPSE